MKKLLFLSILGFLGASSAHAQSTYGYNTGSNSKPSNSNGQNAWNTSSTICDPYKAEKAAENSMKPAVKSLYNAGQSSEDKNINAVRNVYCNPPRRTSTSSTAAQLAH